MINSLKPGQAHVKKQRNTDSHKNIYIYIYKNLYIYIKIIHPVMLLQWPQKKQKEANDVKVKDFNSLRRLGEFENQHKNSTTSSRYTI